MSARLFRTSPPPQAAAGTQMMLGPGFLTELALMTAPTYGSVLETSGVVRFYQFFLPCQLTISKCSIQTGVTNAVQTYMAFGIYDKSFNKVFDSGTFTFPLSSGATVLTNNVGSVTLQPGTYWMAVALEGSTANGCCGMRASSSAERTGMGPLNVAPILKTNSAVWVHGNPLPAVTLATLVIIANDVNLALPYFF